MSKQVICFGDGGIDNNNPLMDLYVLAQSNKKMPKICFLATASGDSPGYIEYFKKVFKNYPCIPSYFSVFNPSTKDMQDLSYPRI